MDNEILTKALGLYTQGFSVFPVKPKSKYPYRGFTWKRYQTKKPTFEQTVEWFRQYPNSNIAVLMGEVSSNLIVIDFDSTYKYVIEWSNSDSYRETYTIKTSRGYHAYFYIENLPRHTYKLDKIDIKSTGYVLSEGSLHPSGKTYQVHVNKPIAHIESIEDVLGLELFIYDAATNNTLFPPHHTRPIELSDNTDLFELAKIVNTKLPVDLCSQIKSRLSVLDVLGISNNDLVKRGDKFWALCPCHDDHDPSLNVDTKSNRVLCYSPSCVLNTKQGNSTIDLYAAMHNLGDREAMYTLGKQLGLLED